MQTPLIGLTSGLTQAQLSKRLSSIHTAYKQAILDSGGKPVYIPVDLNKKELKMELDSFDGVLFTGGGDIQPWRYGSKELDHPDVSGVNAERDQVEIEIFNYIYTRKIPFLGICRGLQLVNVALGGTIYEDIRKQHPNARQHQYGNDHPRDYLAHPVFVKESTLLSRIIQSNPGIVVEKSLPHPGEKIMVNSLHHQGIRKLAPELIASAYADDDIIEAVELQDYPFGMAVQWHPEWLQSIPGMKAIFSTFIASILQGSQVTHAR